MKFTFFAPTVEWVRLIGSWQAEPIAMTRGANGTWTTEVNLENGEHQYAFQLPSRSAFNHGNIVTVGDPRSRLIRNSRSSIVIMDDTDITTDFQWQHRDAALPDNKDLIIYELHVAEFGGSEGFAGVEGRLDYLHDLGITAIELMPVTSFPENHGWGYSVQFPFAPDETYGSPQQLKRLVDQCHARGMRVILDMVFNHAHPDSPLAHIDYYYWFRDERSDEKSYGPKFDYLFQTDGLRPAAQFNLELADYWIGEYLVDGIRVDAAGIIDNFDFLRALRQRCQESAHGRPFILIAEHLPENPPVAAAHGPMDSAWHQHFETAVTRAVVNGDRLDKLAGALQPAGHGYERPELVINYLESHDESSLSYLLTESGASADLVARKLRAAATLLFCAVGIPMIHQGQEWGEKRPLTEEIKPLSWPVDHNELIVWYKRLIRIRRDFPQLRSPVLERLSADGLIVFYRGGQSDPLIVLVNLSSSSRQFPLPDTAKWRDLLGGRILDPAEIACLPLRPFDSAILRRAG